MTNTKSVKLVTAATLATALMGFWGCGGSAAGPTGPSTASASRPGAAATGSTLSSAVVSALNAMLQDERRAEIVYRGVLSDFGNVRPFANIVNAEARHAESIALLLQNHGLSAPVSRWTLDNVPRFGTLAEACAAAEAAERENGALYDRYLALDLPIDVRTVFTNNRSASLEMHLPAFQTCPCPNCLAS